nr:hypothetical protein HK105_004997 [Polyrhizophydium stewartii]
MAVWVMVVQSRRDTTKSNATSEHRMRARAQFAALFPEIKDAYDTFINSYSCAWERDILRHGRMFVTRDRVCFYSAVLAPCKLVLDYLDMRQAERRSIAGVIPNAIRITMLDGKVRAGLLRLGLGRRLGKMVCLLRVG